MGKKKDKGGKGGGKGGAGGATNSNDTKPQQTGPALGQATATAAVTPEKKREPPVENYYTIGKTLSPA